MVRAADSDRIAFEAAVGGVTLRAPWPRTTVVTNRPWDTESIEGASGPAADLPAALFPQEASAPKSKSADPAAAIARTCDDSFGTSRTSPSLARDEPPDVLRASVGS
jgi:hypothetical protein